MAEASPNKTIKNTASFVIRPHGHYTEDLSKSWLIVPLLVLYLSNLGGVGFLGPDEPRYASIGREMARSFDFVTPRLDGSPWFEKPPLLYWMTAAGLLLRLPDEWAARLPVALASLAFLVFFCATLAREFSDRVALSATGILATSAGWLAYSFAALPDLLLSASLGAATMIGLFDTRPKRGGIAGILLGLAVLAKGFVAVVLFAPVFLVARRKRLAILAASVLVAAPWYVLCALRYGPMFWSEFFWKHHVDRFLSPSLEHVQPFWFYLPVMLAGLFPWIPLAGLLARPKTYADVRTRFLLLFLVWGLVFFSASRNKLPGYVLPLLPALAVVLAVGFDSVGRSVEEEVPGRAQAWWLAGCTLLLTATPTIARVLPGALLSGLSRVEPAYALALPFVLAAALVWILAWTGRTPLAFLTAALTAAVAAGYLKSSTFPALDRQVSVRAFWQANRTQAAQACLEAIPRAWEYGLNYYAGRPLHRCEAPAAAWRIVAAGGRLRAVR
jgi:4-amino-4-deoxy-L-arabinose transferase-like glycosyltransferase